MRVLENTQVYRNRIAGRDQPLRIMADLYMPNPPPAKVLGAPVVTPKPKPVTN
jgi:soluble lytic murein transglycosylase